MAKATDGVRDLVTDVLRSLPEPYSEDVTDDVCSAIEADPALMQRYNELAAELRGWVVNNWIGQYTAQLTSRKSGQQVRSRGLLIQSYKKLRV